MATEMIVYFDNLPIRRRYLTREWRQSWAMGPVEYALYRYQAQTRPDIQNTLVYKQGDAV